MIDAHAGAVADKPQLVFRKYGDDYFLWKVFDAGSDLGVEVAESQYEKVLSKGRTPEERQISGRHQAK